MVWQRECSQVAVKNDLQFQFLILLHYLLKAQEDCECAKTLWSMLDWRSRVLYLLWSFFSELRALPGPLSSLENTLAFSSSAFPFFPLLPSQVSSVCIGSCNSLCFLPGKHVLVTSVVIQVALLLMDVQNGTVWGSCSLQLVRLVTPGCEDAICHTYSSLYFTFPFLKKLLHQGP